MVIMTIIILVVIMLNIMARENHSIPIVGGKVSPFLSANYCMMISKFSFSSSCYQGRGLPVGVSFDLILG